MKSRSARVQSLNLGDDRFSHRCFLRPSLWNWLRKDVHVALIPQTTVEACLLTASEEKFASPDACSCNKFVLKNGEIVCCNLWHYPYCTFGCGKCAYRILSTPMSFMEEMIIKSFPCVALFISQYDLCHDEAFYDKWMSLPTICIAWQCIIKLCILGCISSFIFFDMRHPKLSSAVNIGLYLLAALSTLCIWVASTLNFVEVNVKWTLISVSRDFVGKNLVFAFTWTLSTIIFYFALRLCSLLYGWKDYRLEDRPPMVFAFVCFAACWVTTFLAEALTLYMLPESLDPLQSMFTPTCFLTPGSLHGIEVLPTR